MNKNSVNRKKITNFLQPVNIGLMEINVQKSAACIAQDQITHVTSTMENVFMAVKLALKATSVT